MSSERTNKRISRVLARGLNPEHWSFTTLLGAQILMFVLVPLVPVGVARLLMGMFLWAILLMALYAMSDHPIALRLGFVVSFLGIGLDVSYRLTEAHIALKVAGQSFILLFMFFTIFVLLGAVLKKERITYDKLAGAVAVYLLIGITWSVVFQLIESVQPQSFRGAGELGQYNFFYYSMVTMTTVGYGDITPVSRPAQTYSMLLAIVGQMYLTILVARLVALQLSQEEAESQMIEAGCEQSQE